MRLIDADELMEHVGRDRLDSRELIYQMIVNAPTVHVCDPNLEIINKRLMDIDGNLCFRTPARPTKTYPLDGPPIYGCPWCESEIKKGIKYCSECGQAIQWILNE